MFCDEILINIVFDNKLVLFCIVRGEKWLMLKNVFLKLMSSLDFIL